MSKYYIHFPPESGQIIPDLFYDWVQNRARRNKDDLIRRLDESKDFSYWNLSRPQLEESLEVDSKLNKTIHGLYNLHRIVHNDSATSVGDKTPLLAEHLRILRLLFPNGKFIFLIRDSLAAIKSRMDGLGNTIEYATNRWLWATREILNYSDHKVSSMLVKYEDLVASPTDIFSKIEERFSLEKRTASLELTEEMMGDVVMKHHSRSLKKLETDRNNLLSDGLTENQKKYILRKTRVLRAKLGYE